MPLKLPSTFTYLCAKKVKLGVPGSSPGRVCTSCNKSLLRLPGFDSNLGPLLLDILSPISCLFFRTRETELDILLQSCGGSFSTWIGFTWEPFHDSPRSQCLRLFVSFFSSKRHEPFLLSMRDLHCGNILYLFLRRLGGWKSRCRSEIRSWI